ncbi:MAG: EscU/YscU/HrcU family type III secretion system export apparatus switch protein [Methylobacter sp.]|jgi:flagellar biosynthesis protein
MPKTNYTTNLAVALKYDGKSAPKVTGQRTGLMAEQILQIAEQHGI